MTGRITTCDSPMPYVTFSIYGFLFLALILANVSPASAAAVTGQPGMIKALGQPVGAINSTPSADLLLVRRGGGKGRGAGRGGGGRKAGRGGGGGRREYSGGRGGGRSYRGRGGGGRAYRDYNGGGRSYSGWGRKYPNSRSRRYYYGIPFYGYAPYYGYYSYRPSYGRCDYWSRRCAANWGYGNSNYYGCMRYYGCR